jgi:hypothetical protein
MQCGGATGRASKLAGNAARRVLWIVYDEMDQRTPFLQRPADLQLPELDRLRVHDLTLEILTGRISTLDQLAAWLSVQPD